MKRFNVLQSLGVLFVFLLIIWGFVPDKALGSVPQLVNFQGILKDGTGNPVADGSYSVIFTVYDAPAGGTALWAETTSVSTTDGLFTVLLGSLNPVPDTVFYDTSRYLGMAVSPDPEMIPRQRLSSVGYSSVSSQWTSAGQNLFRLNGNVGIGTASPGAKLDVLNSSIRVGSQVTSAGIEFYPAIAGTPTNAGSIVGVGGSTNMAILPVSNLGIGMTSPTEKLDVDGSIAIRNNNALKIFSDGVGLNFSNALGAFGTLDLQKTGDLNPSVRLGHSNFPARAFTIMTGNGTGATTERITVLPTGEVGIGTTSPAKKLDVVGSIKTSDTLFASNVSSNSPLRLQTAGTTRVFINDVTGNVGIGTTSPVNKLDVEGGAVIGAGYSGTNAAPSNGLLVEGNVGIGTTNPIHKLSVAGNVIIGPTSFAQLSVNGNTDVNGQVLIGQFGGNPAAWLHILAPFSATSDPIFRAQETGLGGFLDIRDATSTAGQFIPSIWGEARGTGASRHGLLLVGAPGEDQSDDAAVRIDGRSALAVALVNAPVLSVTNFGVELFRIAATGNVGIGTASPGASNLLELSSTTKGFVLPRMMKTERDAIASPVAGMMVYQTDNTPGLRVYNGTNWMRFTETAD